MMPRPHVRNRWRSGSRAAALLVGWACTACICLGDPPAERVQTLADVDWDKTLLLMDASIQAYRAYDPHPSPPVAPAGYEIVDTWSGFDRMAHHRGAVEVYGLVLRSLEVRSRYVFAFRGTDSLLDALKDLDAAKTAFKPYERSVSVPAGVEVEAGFAGVYTQSDGKQPAMQAQLFALLDRYAAEPEPLGELWITGHSLGSSLSELFTLDVALCRPQLRSSNINFACPRVGNQAFVDFYTAQPAQQDSALRTVRVQNVSDRVPCLPPESMGLVHVPQRFLIAFCEDSLWDPESLLHNHASANYQAVLECASRAEDGVCVRKSLPVPGAKGSLTSVRPEARDVCRCW